MVMFIHVAFFAEYRRVIRDYAIKNHRNLFYYRNRTEPIKLIIITTLSILIIFYSLEPDAQILGTRGGNIISYITSGNFSIIVKIYALFIGLLFVGYMIRIYMNSPISMKKISRINLWGAFLMAGASPILYLFGISKIFPWLMDFLFSGSSLICALCFTHNPQLAYVQLYPVETR